MHKRHKIGVNKLRFGFLKPRRIKAEHGNHHMVLVDDSELAALEHFRRARRVVTAEKCCIDAVRTLSQEEAVEVLLRVLVLRKAGS